MSQAAPYVGEWVLDSARFEFTDGAEAIDIYGPNPSGRVTITAAGRLCAFITAAERGDATDPAALFRSMIAYAGDYVADGDKLVTRVDLSQHPTWVGTDQVRLFEVTGDRLRLSSQPLSHPAHPDSPGCSVFRWTRAA